jgi:hypothetical protein
VSVRLSESVVTMWPAGPTTRLVAGPTFSPETQELIGQYAPPNSEADRQQFELELVVVNSVLVLAVTAVTALVGWLTATHIARHSVVGIYAGAVAVALTGVALHLARYYDALVGKFRKRPRPNLSWPRRSGDLDLIVQLGAGLLIGIVVAY